jgi:hypothetical protein
MKNLALKVIILFLSIPIINSIAFGIGTLFHKPYQSTITQSQFDAYSNSLILTVAITFVSILAIEWTSVKRSLSARSICLLYIGSFLLIAIVSWDQFLFRPYEHALTFLSICTVVITRLLLSKRKTSTVHVSTDTQFS